MNLARTLRRWLPHKTERAVYEAIVAAARHPRLYEKYGVPDTVDGRFEMITVHVMLVLRALALKQAPAIETFRQKLVDEVFRDMDRSLREMGTGDLSVAKKVRKMAEVFYGRVSVYSAALDSSGSNLKASLIRNLLPDGKNDAGASHLAEYLRETDILLKAQDPERIIAGAVIFGEPR
jgi:cytochrome b pre-mRNA-processing protein 3